MYVNIYLATWCVDLDRTTYFRNWTK